MTKRAPPEPSDIPDALNQLSTAFIAAATAYGFDPAELRLRQLTRPPASVTDFLRSGQASSGASPRAPVDLLPEARTSDTTGEVRPLDKIEKRRRRQVRALSEWIWDDRRLSRRGAPRTTDIALILYLSLTIEDWIGRPIPITRGEATNPSGPAFRLLMAAYRFQCTLAEQPVATDETLEKIVRRAKQDVLRDKLKMIPAAYGIYLDNTPVNLIDIVSTWPAQSVLAFSQ